MKLGTVRQREGGGGGEGERLKIMDRCSNCCYNNKHDDLETRSEQLNSPLKRMDSDEDDMVMKKMMIKSAHLSDRFAGQENQSCDS